MDNRNVTQFPFGGVEQNKLSYRQQNLLDVVVGKRSSCLPSNQTMKLKSFWSLQHVCHFFVEKNEHVQKEAVVGPFLNNRTCTYGAVMVVKRSACLPWSSNPAEVDNLFVIFCRMKRYNEHTQKESMVGSFLINRNCTYAFISHSYKFLTIFIRICSTPLCTVQMTILKGTNQGLLQIRFASFFGSGCYVQRTLAIGARITEWLVFSLTIQELTKNNICNYLYVVKQSNPNL